METSQLPDLTDRISFQLWHMNASDGGRRREVGTGQNCIVRNYKLPMFFLDGGYKTIRCIHKMLQSHYLHFFKQNSYILNDF